MKNPVLLLLVLAGLIGVAMVAKKQKENRLSENLRRGVKTRELLVPGLDVNAVKALRIKNADGEVNLKLGANGWSVAERSDYAVDFEKLSRVLMDLRETKIAGKQPIGQGAWEAENLLEPAEGVSKGVGTQVKLLDEKGGDISTLILGGDVEVSGGQGSQFGRTPQKLVRIPSDGDSVWSVATSFGDLQPKPEEWLDKAFIAVADMKSLTVTPAKAEEGWKVSRASKDLTEYALEGAKDGETLDTAKLTLASLLTSASFNDVKTKAEAADLLKDAVKAQIQTFDGFTYDLQVAKVSKDGGDKFYLAVAVKADLPKERQKGKDEKEEDTKRLDEEFKAAQTTLKEKLEKEQKLSAWVFEVAEYTVNNLLLKRADILKKEEPAKEEAPPPAPAAPAAMSAPAAPAPVAPAAAPAAPSAPVSVTTPPVQAPAPKVEVKPEPAPDANPAEASKPAPPPVKP